MLKIDFEILLGKAVQIKRRSADLLDILGNFTSMGKADECCLTVAGAALEFSDRVFKRERAERTERAKAGDIQVSVHRGWIISLAGRPFTVTTSIRHGNRDVVRIRENGEEGSVEFAGMDWIEVFMKRSRDIADQIENRRKRDAKTLKDACDQYRKREGKTK